MYKVQQLNGKEQLELVSRELPNSIPTSSVLLKVHTAGICGSDLEYYTHGYCGSFTPIGPLVLGHEFAGEIVLVGDEVEDFFIGDRVVVDPAMPCMNCDFCIRGNSNFCMNMKFFGSASCVPHIDGGFGEYIVVPSKNCLVFDHTIINWGEAALVEPLMVALSAVLKISDVQCKDIAVFGGGTIGQLIITLLHAFGVKTCALIDIRKEACLFAEKRGVDASYLFNEITNQKYDVCIEASGNIHALKQCYECAQKQGLIVQVGTITKDAILPANLVMTKELTIKGSFRYSKVFKTALQLLERKKINVKDIITHTVSLADLDAGFKLLRDVSVNTMKVQMEIN